MAKTKKSVALPDEVIIRHIIIIRGKKVMIDADLAELYNVPTKQLNQAVKRNAKRFPPDFMFSLNKREKAVLVAEYPQFERLKHSTSIPLAFTEHGAVMLASVLNSKRAIEVNVQIVRIFTRMREMLANNKDILIKLNKLEKKIGDHDHDINVILMHLKEMLNPTVPMRKIGFRPNREE